jgi:hypothetical protein
MAKRRRALSAPAELPVGAALSALSYVPAQAGHQP